MKTNLDHLMQYKIREYKEKGAKYGRVECSIRNGRGWVPSYIGWSSEGRDMVAHFGEVLEAKGYSKAER